MLSRFDAVDLSDNVSEYTKVTGRLDLVYFAPLLDSLCSITLRTLSTVIPVYKEPSEHLTI